MDLTPGLLSTLQKLRLFVDLSTTQMKRLYAICRQESFAAGTELCRAGTESDRMFILVAGAVAICSATGTELDQERAVTTIGETGLLSGEPRAATVRVTEAVSALVIGKRHLLRLLQEDATLAIRLYRNAMVLVRSKLISADERLERVLLEHGPAAG